MLHLTQHTDSRHWTQPRSLTGFCQVQSTTPDCPQKESLWAWPRFHGRTTGHNQSDLLCFFNFKGPNFWPTCLLEESGIWRQNWSASSTSQHNLVCSFSYLLSKKERGNPFKELLRNSKALSSWAKFTQLAFEEWEAGLCFHWEHTALLSKFTSPLDPGTQERLRQEHEDCTRLLSNQIQIDISIPASAGRGRQSSASFKTGWWIASSRSARATERDTASKPKQKSTQ